MNLSTFLDDKEWYDNSKLQTIINCPRKAFYHYTLNGGLDGGVGVGADFGTCFHGGAAAYFAWWGLRPERERRLIGIRTLAALHETLFVGETRTLLENKHSIDSAINNFDFWCDHNLAEDSLLKPIEIELAGAVEITPLEDETFTPFWYAFRIDGIHQRLTYGDYWIREMKTTSSGVERELLKQCLSRQGRGYLYCARQWPSLKFTGIMPDIIGVYVKAFDTRREYYPKPLNDSVSWRAQTIRIVEEWRHRLHLIQNGANPLDIFWQQTNECTAYGKCSFFDLCQFGLSPVTLNQFHPNIWNPLALVETPLPDVNKVSIVENNKIKESIKL